MEDQGKRLLLAVVIAFGIMMAWSYFFPTEQPPKQLDETVETGTGTQPGGDASKPAPGTDAAKPQPAGGQAGSLELPPAGERGPEQLYELEFDAFRAVFTSYGGTLKSWELKGEKYQEEKNGKNQQIDLVRTSDDETLLPFSVGFGQVELVPEKSEWKATRKSDTEIAFTWSYTTKKDGADAVLFDIVKTYQLYPDDYLLQLTVEVHNRAAASQKLPLALALYGYQDPNQDTGGGFFTQVDSSWKAACYANDELHTGVPLQRNGAVRWAGFTQSYFLVAASPKVEAGTQLGCSTSMVSGRPGVMRTDIVFPVVSMNAGDPPMSRTVVAYLGPKYLDTLEHISAVAGYDPGFGHAIDLGWFEVLARPLLWLLQWSYSFLGNWGLSIVFLTILVKLATLYWTTKSMRSMKQMAKLKPKIEAIQKKYKDDKQRQQVEVMNLYKAHKVNPLAGCLPMLLQMPIWFALYRMLSAAAELYHAPFIPGWIDDLTAADPFYILPIVLMGMMFLQAKLSPTAADSSQQKIMMYGLPLTFGVFSFFFPSGLTLYILTNTVLTTLHQLWMNRTDPTSPAKAVAGKVSEPAARAEEGTDEQAAAPRASGPSEPDAGQRQSSGKSTQKRDGQKKRSGKARKRGGAS